MTGANLNSVNSRAFHLFVKTYRNFSIFVDADDLFARIPQSLNVGYCIFVKHFAGTDQGDSRGIRYDRGSADLPFCFNKGYAFPFFLELRKAVFFLRAAEGVSGLGT